MTRIRADYVFGTTNAALAVGDTTLSSAGLSRLPVVASPDIAAVTLYDQAAGTYEIVWVTAHSSGATTATIQRGKEGSSAAAWSSGASWLHGPTVNDITRVGCIAYHTAGTSTGNAAEATVSLGAEVWDTSAFHDNTTNNTRLTVPTGLGGLYQILAQVSFAYGPNGNRAAQIWKNGAKVIEMGVSASVSSRAQVAMFDFLNPGDYIELGEYQNSGGSLALNATGETKLSLIRVDA